MVVGKEADPEFVEKVHEVATSHSPYMTLDTVPRGLARRARDVGDGEARLMPGCSRCAGFRYSSECSVKQLFLLRYHSLYTRPQVAMSHQL